MLHPLGLYIPGYQLRFCLLDFHFCFIFVSYMKLFLQHIAVSHQIKINCTDNNNDTNDNSNFRQLIKVAS